MSKLSAEDRIALGPDKLNDLRQSAPATKAAGLKALRYSLQHLTEHMHVGDGLKTLQKLNQKGGFDCPGCAWPDPDGNRSPMAEYCENGVKAIAEEASKRTIGASFFREHSIRELGELSDFELGKQGRLTEPMVLRPGKSHYEPIDWASAFSLIGDQLNQLNSPNEAIFYTSGRTSNEAAFMYQLFVRQFGTNNLPDCSNMCHESTGTALSETLGLGKGSVTLEDIHQAELIICLGQNPGTNHPRMLTALEKCKENGGKIITVNPLPEAGLLKFSNPQRPFKLLAGGTTLTDLFLQIRINEDLSLVRAICQLLVEREAQSPGEIFDQDFIEASTAGYSKWLAMLAENDLDACISHTGLDRQDIEAAVELIAQRKRIIICYAMGLTQHENSVDVIKEMVNLLLAKGAMGKTGAGICPVRGHSNVQGDRTVGIWEVLKPAFAQRLQARFQFTPPSATGYDVVNSVKAMAEGKASVFVGMGGNFLSATPDTLYTAKGLRQCELTVQVSTKLNRSHLVHGKMALILPCLGRTEVDLQASGEQFVSCENSMGVVQMSKGILSPTSDQLKSECAIVAGIAKATLQEKAGSHWDAFIRNYDEIRDAIEACVPGFERYNERVRQTAGFYLPNGPRNRQFNTKDGKAQFSLTKNQHHQLKKGEFLMMTVRSHDQYNTTIYGLDDRYRGLYRERRVVMMNPEDMTAADLAEKDIVDLVSTYDGEERRARNFVVVPYPIPTRNVATYFPEANVLIPITRTARGSNTPISKSVKVKIFK